MTDPYGLRNTPPAHGQHGDGPPGLPPPGLQGFVSYGQGAAPPSIYVPAPMSANNELRMLEDEGQLWLMIAAVGFWICLGWITGPLAWYYGSKIRRQYRTLGHHSGTSANWAWGLGIASTLIYYVGTTLFLMFISS